jgi:DNA-binding Xre family transcriptional regulator
MQAQLFRGFRKVIQFANTSDMDLKDTIAKRMRELGLNANSAAKRFGMPQNAFRYALEGRAIRYDRLVAICGALDINIIFEVADGTSFRETNGTKNVDAGLLAEIMYGVIHEATQRGVILQFDRIAEETARVYASATANNASLEDTFSTTKETA